MTQNALTPIKYVGPRPTYTDAMFGTRIEWTFGETQLVPAQAAKRMLRHPDVYVLGEATDDTLVAEVPEPNEKKDEEDKDQDMRDTVAAMDKNTLEQFAKTHFKVDLDKRKGVGVLRNEVIGLIDQFGVQ